MSLQLYLENETEVSFDFPIEKIAEDVITKVLEVEKCPYDVPDLRETRTYRL